jgi:hypothetical protein
MNMIVVLLLVFWAPSADRPTSAPVEFFVNGEDCQSRAQALTSEWESTVHGGSTSWACFAALRVPTT